MKKILVATEKPFAPAAVVAIRQKCEESGHELILLEKYASTDELMNAITDVDACIIRSDKLTPAVLAAAKQLKIAVRAGAGYDNVNLEAATNQGIVVMNTPGQNSNAVAELVVGMMVYAARGMYNGKPGTELRGKKLGIHAYGNVGSRVAKLAQAFGMTVCAYDPFLKDGVLAADGVENFENVDTMYQTCDYLSLNMPLVEDTKNFVHYSRLLKTKKGVCIINTARKEVICEKGLQMALEDRDDIKYFSDIAPNCAAELKENYPTQVFFTPKKMGASTKEANVNAGVAAINQIINYFANGDTTFQVNK